MRCFAVEFWLENCLTFSTEENQTSWKCFKPNIYPNKNFPDLYPVVSFYILTIGTHENILWEHMSWGLQPVANMGCEDLVLLRSHQDLADVTHHLVAGRLRLRKILSEKESFPTKSVTSSCFLLCRWCRGLFFSTSSPWIKSVITL